MKRFFLARHGKTTANEQGIRQGWCDFPLTEEGIKELNQTKTQIQNIPFSGVYSSDLKRAADSAKILTGKEPVKRKELREQSFGKYDGKQAATIPDGEGESVEECVSRFMDGLLDIINKEDLPLIVTHGVPAFCLYAIAEKGDLPDLPGIGNGWVFDCLFDGRMFHILGIITPDGIQYRTKPE